MFSYTVMVIDLIDPVDFLTPVNTVNIVNNHVPIDQWANFPSPPLQKFAGWLTFAPRAYPCLVAVGRT